MRFEGRTFRKGRYWVSELPILQVVTQGTSRSDAYAMIKDAVELLAEPLPLRIRVHPKDRGRFEIEAHDDAALFALLLKRRRQMSGLSLSEVTERLGLKSRNSYARYEQGRAVPTVRKLGELLEAVSPNQEFVLKQSA